MNKRIFKITIIIGVLSILMCSFFSFILYYKDYKINNEDDLTRLISLIDSTLNYEDDKIRYLENISKFDEDIRITYVDNEGKILFDSYGDDVEIANHISSEEFADSVKTGIYNPNKYSMGMFKDVYYNAFKLNDGNFLRVSKETDSILVLTFKFLPAYLGIILFVIFLSKVFSKKTTDNILKYVKSDIESPSIINTDEVPEISPIMFEMNEQRDIIRKQFEELKIERDTVNLIIENMEEGFLMINKKKNILLLNKAILDFLNVKSNVLNKNILYLTRNEKIINSIEDALNGNSNEGIISSSGRDIKYYSNPVYLGEDIGGSILFLIDETEQIRSLKMREEFSANVSHELKTPLTSIYGFSELLINNMVSSEKNRHEILVNIYTESKRLLKLTDDIIKISKLEGSPEISNTIVNLRNIVEDVFKVFSKEAESRNITMTVEGEATVVANETMMWEMFVNLVENSIKYNKENGKVFVELKQNNNVEISVIDTGIGIEKGKQDRIFERFYRVDESRNKKTGGTGLGLSIVKHIIKSHGGEIFIKSEINKGTEIKVFFPSGKQI